MTPSQVAKKAGCSAETVRRYIRTGKLKPKETFRSPNGTPFYTLSPDAVSKVKKLIDPRGRRS